MMAAVPGTPASKSTPACLCPCAAQALPKAQAALDGETSFFRKSTRHKQAKGRAIPGRIKTYVVQHSVTRKLLPRAISPHLSQFRVLKSLQSFFPPSSSKHLPGSAPAQPGSTNPQDARPEGGWVGGHPLPSTGSGTGPMCPHTPFAAVGRASSSTEQHQAMPPSTGLAVLQRGRWAPVKRPICPQDPAATPEPPGRAQGQQFTCSDPPLCQPKPAAASRFQRSQVPTLNELPKDHKATA